MKKILHAQADKGNFEEMKRLIDQQINSKDKNQETLLHKASEQGDLMAVQYLIQVGAQLEAKNSYGRTPLHSAKTYEIAACLIQKGAQVDSIDEVNRTPLHLVERIQIAACLIQNGAQIDAKDRFGWTPLHEAVIRNRFDIVNCLVENGAQITARTNDGNETPFDLAKEKGLIQIAKYLLEMKKESESQNPQENASNKDLCIICLTTKNGFYTLIPCGHASLCEPCCFYLKNEYNGKCPSCRTPISGYQKIFF